MQSVFFVFYYELFILEIQIFIETETCTKLKSDSWSVISEVLGYLLAHMLARELITKLNLIAPFFTETMTRA